MAKKDNRKCRLRCIKSLKEVTESSLREIVYVGITAIIVYILINWDKILAFANWLGLK